MSRATFFRNVSRDHFELPIAKRKLDYCQKCMQREKMLSPIMREFVCPVRTECLVLDRMCWHHWDDVVYKRFSTDDGDEHRVRAHLRYLDEGSLFFHEDGTTQY